MNCAGQNLQDAIDNTPSGATILVTGVCVGQFTIANSSGTAGQGVRSGEWWIRPRGLG